MSLSQLFNEVKGKIGDPNKKALLPPDDVLQHKEKCSSQKHKMRGKREVFLLLSADDLARVAQISLF